MSHHRLATFKWLAAHLPLQAMVGTEGKHQRQHAYLVMHRLQHTGLSQESPTMPRTSAEV